MKPMRIKKQNTKKGTTKTVPKPLDHLWHLTKIIEEGENA